MSKFNPIEIAKKTTDEFGHYEDIHFRIQPFMKAMAGETGKRIGFDNLSQFYRFLFAVGLKKVLQDENDNNIPSSICINLDLINYIIKKEFAGMMLKNAIKVFEICKNTNDINKMQWLLKKSEEIYKENKDKDWKSLVNSIKASLRKRRKND